MDNDIMNAMEVITKTALLLVAANKDYYINDSKDIVFKPRANEYMVAINEAIRNIDEAYKKYINDYCIGEGD